MNYSVAIRTLGLNQALLRRTLESVFAQSLPPDKVVIYIAEGYAVPDFRVGGEEYVPVKKGMVAQRALRYDEIDSDFILMLDDDVALSPDSVAILFDGISEYNLDCISPDTFANHKMSAKAKIYSLLSNLTYAHHDRKYAFKLHRTGSFSFIGRPDPGVMLSQTAAGPCSLWRKTTLLRIALCHERWLDSLGFAFNDDGLEFYKLYVNGGRLGVHFNAGVEHLGGQTSSGAYRRDPKRFYMRAKADYLVWHRALLSWRKGRLDRLATASAYWTKVVLTFPAVCVAALLMRRLNVPYLHLKGIADGIAFSHSSAYRSLPPYALAKNPSHKK